MIILLLTGCNTTAQDSPQASPPDVVTETQAEMDETTIPENPQPFTPEVVAELQAEMDDLTAAELPPGMVVWIDAPANRFAGASGFANLKDDTPTTTEGPFGLAASPRCLPPRSSCS